VEQINTQTVVSSEIPEPSTQTAMGSDEQHEAIESTDKRAGRGHGSQPIHGAILDSIREQSPHAAPASQQLACWAGEQLEPSQAVGIGNPASEISAGTQRSHEQTEIESALAEVRQTWQKYRCTNLRIAVYYYLEAVFELVRRWQRLKCSLKNSRAALRLQPNAPKLRVEPFAIVIFCTCDPEIADAKTRSKWSRVLRFARKMKPAGQTLTDFIQANGGLNECARRFARGSGA
jgi:hypothetical protein